MSMFRAEMPCHPFVRLSVEKRTTLAAFLNIPQRQVIALPVSVEISAPLAPLCGISPFSPGFITGQTADHRAFAARIVDEFER